MTEPISLSFSDAIESSRAAILKSQDQHALEQFLDSERIAKLKERDFVDAIKRLFMWSRLEVVDLQILLALDSQAAWALVPDDLAKSCGDTVTDVIGRSIHTQCDAEQWFQLGESVMENLGHHYAAVEAYEMALRVDQHHFPSILSKGQIFCLYPDTQDRALEALELAAQLKPGDEEVWVALGQLHSMHEGKSREAEECFTKAVDLSPTWYTYMYLGDHYLYQQQMPEEAKAAFESALEHDPECCPALENLAEVHRVFYEDYDQAESLLLRSTELFDDREESWVLLGRLLSQHSERCQDAERYFLKALEVDPESGDAAHGLGYLYAIRMHRYQDAIEAFEKSAHLRPGIPYGWSAVGNVNAEFLGRYQQAEQAYQKALQVDPTEVATGLNYVYLLRDCMNRIEDAKVEFEKVEKAESLPQWEAAVPLHRALFAANDGDWDAAEMNLVQAIDSLHGEFPQSSSDDWVRAVVSLMRLGYLPQIQQCFTEHLTDPELKTLPQALEYFKNAKRDPQVQQQLDAIMQSERYYQHGTLEWFVQHIQVRLNALATAAAVG